MQAKVSSHHANDCCLPSSERHRTADDLSVVGEPSLGKRWREDDDVAFVGMREPPAFGAGPGEFPEVCGHGDQSTARQSGGRVHGRVPRTIRGHGVEGRRLRAPVNEVWPEEQPFKVNRHELIKALREELGREARDFNFVSGSDAKSIFRYEMHTLPSEVQQSIGTSTLFAAWNAASYVAQIEDERIENAMRDGDQYLQGTAKVLKKHRGLWFNDESFVVSRKQ